MNKCQRCDEIYGPMEAEYIRYERLKSNKTLALIGGDIQVAAKLMVEMRTSEALKALMLQERDEHLAAAHAHDRAAWIGGCQ